MSTQEKAAAGSRELGSIWIGLLPSDGTKLLSHHPLLGAFSCGEADLGTVQELLVQHHLYSRYFTRFLCALISNLPEVEDVKILSQNLVEELGVDQKCGMSHAELFLQSMRAVGVAPNSRRALPGTEELTAAMFQYCRSPNPLDGLAAMCLGAEAIVPLIYHPIIVALTNLGIPADGRHFFELHVAEDEGHALAMLQIMTRLIGNNAVAEQRAKNVGRNMIARRLRFLDDVWAISRNAASGAGRADTGT